MPEASRELLAPWAEAEAEAERKEQGTELE